MSIDSKIRDVANKSKVNIIIPIVLTLGICGLILMFSIEQSFAINYIRSHLVERLKSHNCVIVT